MCRKREV